MVTMSVRPCRRIEPGSDVAGGEHAPGADHPPVGVAVDPLGAVRELTEGARIEVGAEADQRQVRRQGAAVSQHGFDAAGFFHPPEKRPSMIRNLRVAIGRARFTDQEVRTFRGVVTALAKGRGRVLAKLAAKKAADGAPAAKPGEGGGAE